jgi:tryptophanyl-tRNA synthetase
LIKIYKEINKFLIELIQIHKEDIQSDVKEEIRNATDHFIEVKEQIDLILKNTLEETNKKVSKIKDI